MLYYCLLDHKKEVILSNFTDILMNEIQKVESQSEIIFIDNVKYRVGKKKDEEIGTVFLLTNEINEINSSRVFKERITLYITFINQIKQIKKNILDRILHDITKINGHCIQELFKIIPEEFSQFKTYPDQIQFLDNNLKKNSRNISKSLFKLNREVLNLKTECTNLKYIYGDQIIVNKKNHKIGNAIMPALHIYIPFLREKGVVVEIRGKLRDKEIFLDFEYLECALVPLLDNINKYIFPKSNLLIYFEKTIDGFSINFDMISLSIAKEEADLLFDDGYSGINAIRSGLSGKGLGMNKIKKALEVNEAELRITVNLEKKAQRRFKQKKYERNVFQLVFMNQ